MGCFLNAVPDYFIKVAETKFPVVNFMFLGLQIKVEEFFNLYFSDNAINFIKSFHTRRGDKEFKCSSWFLHDKFGHVRDMSYQHPIKVYLALTNFCFYKVQNFVAARSLRNFKFTETGCFVIPYGALLLHMLFYG
ncbi:hypothetical protein Golob_007812 [Gossypium lobatum]|uniref:VASt domain-containing protein n=1 Tax=Gossypium lobatum TaxID=34289 RepID=A0A7J8MDK6_9ROSI|nr:hypothetical protein [Gossypium lobatum]